MLETAPVPVLAPAAFPRSGAPRRLHVSRSTAVLAGAVVLVVAAVLTAGALGVRLFVVESPSMGTTAPVGSLVVGSADAAAADVGDIITFQPPGAGRTPYTHRIVDRTAGGYRTRGDINGRADPWTVRPSWVVARTTAVVPGLGWLLKAAPVLLGALVVAQVVGLFVQAPATRWSIRTAAVAAAVAFVSWTVRPFSGFLLLQSGATDEGLRASVVSTALLPIRVSAAGGGHVDLLAGQVGRLLLPGDAGGRVTMTAQLQLAPAGWAAVVLGCLLPVLVVLLVGVPVEDRRDAAA